MLTTIYTFALGLIVAAFTEIGIYTFVKDPPSDMSDYFVDHTTATEAELKEREEKRETHRDQMRRFHCTVSTLSLIFATALLAVSLNLPSKLVILSDGVLLGGVFSLVFGVGLGIHTGEKVFRFVVAAASMIIALSLGYLKFVPH